MSVDVKLFNMCDHYTGNKQYKPELCPKCGGKGYYYDIFFDQAGKPQLTTGSIKLQQEMLKMINDIKGDNVFFPRWGSELHNLVGQKITKTPGIKAKWMVVQCLEYLRTLQLVANKQFENLTDDEILLGIEQINLTNFVTGYNIDVTISNISNEILEQSILL